MSRRLGKSGGALAAPVVRLDDNVGTYDVRRDGRSGEGRVQNVRLDRVEASPFQVRRVFAEYLVVARAITPAVLAEAGVVRGSEPDHQRMARLPLAALKRVSQAAGSIGA
ncbi:MAG: hypothetical protein ICV87_14515 [Gemmatimonadetes bacterium]|nr:hypothetical protein [Gemmatimonadota bacterium]